MSDWTFFSNHAHVLFVLSKKELITVRELSLEVGITERFAHKVIHDLHEEGYLTVHNEGRNNIYKVNSKRQLRHPVEGHIRIGDLIGFISNEKT